MHSQENKQDDTASQHGDPARSSQGATAEGPQLGEKHKKTSKKATYASKVRPTPGSKKWVKTSTRGSVSSGLILASVNDAISRERGNADAIREMKEEKEQKEPAKQEQKSDKEKEKVPPPLQPNFDANSQVILTWMPEVPTSSWVDVSLMLLCLAYPTTMGRAAIIRKAYGIIRPFFAKHLVSLVSWLNPSRPVSLDAVTAARNIGLKKFHWRSFIASYVLSQIRTEGPSGKRKVRSAFFQLCNVVAPVNESRGFFAHSAKLSTVRTELTVYQAYRNAETREEIIDLVESAQTEVRHSLAPEAELGTLVRQHVSRLLYSNIAPAHYAATQEDTSLFAIDRVLSRRLESQVSSLGNWYLGAAAAVFVGSSLLEFLIPPKWRRMFAGAMAGVYEELACRDRPWIRLLIMSVEHFGYGEKSHNAPTHAFLDTLPLRYSIAFHVIHNVLVSYSKTAKLSVCDTFFSSLFLPVFLSSGLIERVVSFFSVLKHAAVNLFSPSVSNVKAMGYRLGEVELPAARPSSAEFELFPNFDDPAPREPVQSLVGFGFTEIAPPMPDPNHAPTVLLGAQHRFACDMPGPEKGLLLELQEFVRDYVTQHYDPILPGELPTVDEWLETTNYSLGRKQELKRAYEAANEGVCSDDYGIKSFAKRETYMSYKHARGINSRSDAFKCFVGPAFSKIESVVYQSPHFIKHVPVKDRPQFLVDRLGGHTGPWYESDYTSFEGSFSPHFMYHCEMVLYRHMLVHYPGVYHHIVRAMLGVNKCRFKWFYIKVRARRMSGEMCTSLGNGFTNLMLAMFCAHKSGVDIDIIVEGDDGLFCTSGPIDMSYSARFGFDLKLLVHQSLLQSSFCGLQLTSELTSMTDPRKVLVNFGWSHSWQCFGGPRVQLGLFRAKAMSLLYEHPRCPILTALAQRGLLLTSGIKAIFSSNWYEKQLEQEVRSNVGWIHEEVRKGISLSMRGEFADLYGIGVCEQIAIEQEISKWQLGCVTGSFALSCFGPKHADLFSYSDQFRI